MASLNKKSVDESHEAQLAEFRNFLKKHESTSNLTIQEECDIIGIGDFGLILTNPIPANGPRGEKKYLERLRCNCNSKLLFHRLGSKGFTNIEGGIDVYETVCYKGKHWNIIYLSMYYPRRSTLTPEGYKFDNLPPEFAQLPILTGVNLFVEDFPYNLPNYLLGNIDIDVAIDPRWAFKETFDLVLYQAYEAHELKNEVTPLTKKLINDLNQYLLENHLLFKKSESYIEKFNEAWNGLCDQIKAKDK